MHSINPYTHQIIDTYDLMKDIEIENELQLIATRYFEWRNTSLNDRINLAESLIKTIISCKLALAHLIVTEMGKPIKEAIAEVEKCIDLVRYYKDNLDTFLKPIVSESGKKHLTIYQPTGIVLGIMPWNFPVWQVFRYAIPNILAGNVCILKHAPNVFGCGDYLTNLFIKAGFPKNVFTDFKINVDQIEKIIQFPITQGVCITGSINAGKAVANLAGKYLKKSVVELGGIDPFIILEDAPLEKALDAAFISRMNNAGQVCIAAKKVFTPEHLLKKAISYLSEKFNQIQLGDPALATTQMGPISKKEFLEVLATQVDNAIKKGAQLIVGGNRKDPFFEPTLLVVDKNNPALNEEIFGPILCIIPYQSTEEVIQNINQSSYGLGAAIWSNNTSTAYQIAYQIDAGYIAINDLVKSNPGIAFGGIKNSGYGKELGKSGLYSFLNEKVICL